MFLGDTFFAWTRLFRGRGTRRTPLFREANFFFTETEDEEEWLEWVDWGSTWGREHRSKAPAAPQLHERQKNTKFASVVLCV